MYPTNEIVIERPEIIEPSMQEENQSQEKLSDEGDNWAINNALPPWSWILKSLVITPKSYYLRTPKGHKNTVYLDAEEVCGSLFL